MISCAQYDSIEVVCLYQFPLELTLKSGDKVTGVALDTERNSSGVECIKITTVEGDILVVLDEISIMEVGVDNPHVKRIIFD